MTTGSRAVVLRERLPSSEAKRPKDLHLTTGLQLPRLDRGGDGGTERCAEDCTAINGGVTRDS
jgi:hypothetical protein